MIKEPSIGLLNIISGLIILFKSIKENLVEINSTTAISIAIVVISVTCIIGIVSFKYADIGENIKNKETAKLAQELHDNPEYRILFDAARDLKPDDLKAVIDIANRIKGTYNG